MSFLEDLYKYRHMAPCPERSWSWVYRGQACVACRRLEGCVAWPTTDLPDNIKPSKGAQPS